MDPRLRRRLARLARRQHGVVTREDLLGLGMTSHAIDWALTTHQLVALFPGVYRVSGAPDTWRGRALAAQRRVARQLNRLASDGAPPAIVAVGGPAAAHLHGLPGHTRAPDLTLAASRRSRATALPVAVRPSLSSADVVEVDHIPATSLAWSAIEVSAPARTSDGRDLLASLLATGRVRRGQLIGAAHRADGLRGRDGVLTVLSDLGRTPDHVRSHTERVLVDACLMAGAPRPRTNLRVTTTAGSTYELDVAWPELLLDIEVDGPHHLAPDQRGRDRERDRGLRRDGWEVARFPVEEIDEDPRDVAERVRSLIDRRRTALGATADSAVSVHPGPTGVD